RAQRVVFPGLVRFVRQRTDRTVSCGASCLFWIAGPALIGGAPDQCQGALIHREKHMEIAQRQRRFERLVGQFIDDLQRFALWLAHDPGVAQDIVQETLLRAWCSLHQLNDDSSVKAWLITILRRENARRFERERFQTVDIDDFAIPDESIDRPEHELEVRALRSRIKELPDAYREPLVLQVILGHSVLEIAEIMEISRSAAMTRLFRARQKMKERLIHERAVEGTDDVREAT
ncbi:MAG: sigma-70 family RNA polymerase sigma factor, partial [Wenzhouxiangellaceae bacterium]